MVTSPAFSPIPWVLWQLGKVMTLMRKPGHLNRRFIGDYSHPVYQDLLVPLTAQYSQFQPPAYQLKRYGKWGVLLCLPNCWFPRVDFSQLSCIHFHVPECKCIPWMNVKCHVYFWAFYSKSNYIQSPVCNLRSWEVSSQIHCLKANNQTTRSVSLFHTRHCKCLSMILCFHADKKDDQIWLPIKLLLLQACCSAHATLLPLLSLHLFLAVSVLCWKYHPFPHLHI